jgi:hypothetical protein
MYKLVYLMCALTSAMCAWLLLRSYFGGRFRLLLWSGLCFVGFTVNNVLLIVDRLLFPEVDLSVWRQTSALLALLLLLYGLILEDRS